MCKKKVQPPWRVLVLDAAHAPNHQNTIVGSQQWHPLRVLLPLFLRPVCLSLQDCHPAAAAGTRCVLRRALLLLALMSVPRSNSVSLIRLLVTKVNHRTQAYLGLGQYNATARNNAIWSLGMNTCCLHVLVWCRPLFHGFERVQPRPGALDFARGAHFLCSLSCGYSQAFCLWLVQHWDESHVFFFSAWLVPYLRCKWLPKSQLTTANFQFTEGVVGKLGSKMCKNWRKSSIFMIKWWSTLCKIEEKCQNMW